MSRRGSPFAPPVAADDPARTRHRIREPDLAAVGTEHRHVALFHEQRVAEILRTDRRSCRHAFTSARSLNAERASSNTASTSSVRKGGICLHEQAGIEAEHLDELVYELGRLVDSGFPPDDREPAAFGADEFGEPVLGELLALPGGLDRFTDMRVPCHVTSYMSRGFTCQVLLHLRRAGTFVKLRHVAEPGGATTLKSLRKRTTPTGRSRVPYLTQNEVADKARIDRSVYNQLERNGAGRKLSPTYAERLAPVLGEQVWQLVEEEEARREGLEAEVVTLRKDFEEFVQAVTARLADLEDGQGREAQPSTRQKKA